VLIYCDQAIRGKAARLSRCAVAKAFNDSAVVRQSLQSGVKISAVVSHGLWLCTIVPWWIARTVFQGVLLLSPVCSG
jgi:hypothetical protein